jgi:FMN phosphatase YigB (HAD superfamily)
MESLKLQPEECMVVGNDVAEDMCAAKLNMKTFLLTDCLINSKKADLSGMQQGSFRDLYEYIKGLPVVENRENGGFSPLKSE